MPTETELVWAAGFFDGEGHIGAHLCNGRNGYAHWKLSLMVVNTHTPSVEIFQRLFGGTIKHRTNGRRVDGSNCKEISVWRAPEQQIGEILRRLVPHLVTKKQQALLAIEFRQTYRGYVRGAGVFLPDEVKQERADFASRIRLLNNCA